MASGPSPDHARLIRKLETIAELSSGDRSAIAALPLRIKAFDENADLVREGERPSDCCLILDGLACRYKVLGAGQRQIMSFHLPGDIPDFMATHLAVMDHSLGALTPGRAAYVAHAALSDLLATHPGVAEAFWRDVLIDAAIFRE